MIIILCILVFWLFFVIVHCSYIPNNTVYRTNEEVLKEIRDDIDRMRNDSRYNKPSQAAQLMSWEDMSI
jgi:hypothetical protein